LFSYPAWFVFAGLSALLAGSFLNADVTARVNYLHHALVPAHNVAAVLLPLKMRSGSRYPSTCCLEKSSREYVSLGLLPPSAVTSRKKGRKRHVAGLLRHLLRRYVTAATTSSTGCCVKVPAAAHSWNFLFLSTLCYSILCCSSSCPLLLPYSAFF
jgi:hypothetical protein